MGDKVMQTKNDYDREVFNGDVGRIVRERRVDSEEQNSSGFSAFKRPVRQGGKRLVVEYDDREVDYDDPALDALTLAYATTVHKSQGSEYPAVVIPLLTSHFVMLSRPLLYTAMTRARRLCILVADPKAVQLALGETRKEQRLTRLAARLATDF
jgi:exodeoxyribonuclease V alpha subunit